MGWLLNFLEKVGLLKTDNSQEETSSVNTIHVNELQDWLKGKEENIISHHQLEQEVLSHVNKLKDKRWFLECKLDEWEKKIKSLGISYRTQDITSILSETRKVLDLLELPEKHTIQSTLILGAKLEPRLEELRKDIAASSFSYNYAFLLPREEREAKENPLLQLLNSLTALKDSFEEKIVKSGYSKIETLSKKAAQLEEQVDKLKVLNQQMSLLEEKISCVDEKKEEKKRELKEIKDSPQSYELTENEQRMKKLRTNLEHNEDEVFIFFSKLKPALQIFLGLEGENKLVSEYLKHPYKALREDQGLAILSVSRKLKQALIDGKIELDAETARTTFNYLEKIEAGYLQALRNRYFEIVHELEDVKGTTADKDFAMKLEEAKYRLEHFHNQREKLEQEKITLEEEIKVQINIWDKEADLFKNLIKISLDQEIEIKT